MKTKLLIALFVAVFFFAFSSVQSVFAQDAPQTYLNVTVYYQLHVGLSDGAEVVVFNSSGDPIFDGGITGPPNFERGMVAFSLSGISAGTYTIKAWHFPRPNDNSWGETTFYYSGTGSANEEVVLSPNY